MPRSVLCTKRLPLLIRTVPLAVLLASTPFPAEAPEELRSTAPESRMMSSVPAVASPTLRPGLAVLPLGSTRVIVRVAAGVMVSRLMLTVVAPPGRLTV